VTRSSVAESTGPNHQPNGRPIRSNHLLATGAVQEHLGQLLQTLRIRNRLQPIARQGRDLRPEALLRLPHQTASLV
jgi:hypothetical protein